VQASVEDHTLLENLHTATADKFKELAATASAQNKELAALKAKHAVRKCLRLCLEAESKGWVQGALEFEWDLPSTPFMIRRCAMHTRKLKGIETLALLPRTTN